MTEFKFDKDKHTIKNIDVMKKEIADVIFNATASELYEYTLFLELPKVTPNSVLTCKKCKVKYGECDKATLSDKECKRRFIRHCNEQFVRGDMKNE